VTFNLFCAILFLLILGEKAMSTVLVTGASGDIGKAICRQFLNKDYEVIGIYNKNATPLESLATEFADSFRVFQCDLSDFEEIKLLTGKLQNFNIDILVNNAGISVVGLLQDLTPEKWDNIWNTNVTSAVALSGQLIPMFLRNGHGKIINISSVWGNRGASCEVAYSTTKGAINTFTKALALELAPSNIQVNAISCGIIDTKMNAHLTAEDIADIVEEIPAGRIGKPEDIADAVYAIATAGDYLTGQIITVDGGWQM
jgi:3-oxoacyl-[acyl-carrier protein] reductase